MITKAIIKSVNYASNTCNIVIPLFEQAGIKNNTEFEATMVVPPGIHSGYRPEDVVFISFYDNSLSLPVVLGKLYINDNEKLTDKESATRSNVLSSLYKQTGFVGCNHLEVDGKAFLPLSATYFTKDASTHNGLEYESLSKLIDTIEDLKSKVATLEKVVWAAHPATALTATAVDAGADAIIK